MNDLKKINGERYKNETINKYDKLFHLVDYKTLDFDWFTFMNDGFMPLDCNEFPIEDNAFPQLLDHHIFWKYQVYLYISLLRLANVPSNIKQGNLLDIGCGRGGGLSAYRDYFKFDSLTGIDINKNQIDFCKRVHQSINFIEGSAEELPFKNNTFDIITSVESESYYFWYKEFVNEVYRTLVPGGLFLCTDVFYGNRVNEVIFHFINNNFELVLHADITANVRSACAINKYSMLSRSNFIANIMMWDEERYYTNRNNQSDKPGATYRILIFKKLNIN
jgi:ubiquinone/menaquinone biosynthesis C-methylase UbiE